MRIASTFACLSACAVPLFAVAASAQSGAGGSVSGSATVEVGGGNQPTPATQPPPPVVYQPAPAPAPAPTYATPPPPPSNTYVVEPLHPSSYVHDGFYLRFAMGGGWLNGSGNVDTGSSAGIPDFTLKGGGFAFDLGIGGTVGRGVVIGGEYLFQQAVKPSFTFNGGASQTSDSNVNFGIIGPFIDWFPDPEGGFHVGGLLGVAALTASDPNTGQTKNADTGFGGGVGVGYDFWVAPEWSLGILGKFAGGTVHNSNQSIGSANANENISVGIASLLFSVLYH